MHVCDNEMFCVIYTVGDLHVQSAFLHLKLIKFSGTAIWNEKNCGYKYLGSFLHMFWIEHALSGEKDTTAKSSSHELFGRKIVFKAWNKWSKEIPVLFCSTFKTQTAWLMIIANSKHATPWKLWQCIIGRFVKQITRLVDDKLKFGNLNVFWQAGKKPRCNLWRSGTCKLKIML